MKSLKDEELLYLYVNDSDGRDLTAMFSSDDNDEFSEYLHDLALELESRELLDITSEIEVADGKPIIFQKHRLNNKALIVLNEVFLMVAHWAESDIDEQEHIQKLHKKLYEVGREF